MKEILLATSNNYKKEQFNYLLDEFNLKIKNLQDIRAESKPVENKKTARENALLKAEFWSKRVKIPVFSDDAGLEIDALNKEPGVKARRWGCRFSDEVSDEEWLTYLLERMKGIPFSKRTAKFRAAWAVVFPTGKKIIKDITLPFYILEEPKGDYPSGSPISAVRFYPEYKKAEIELTKKEQWEKLKEEMENWKEFRDYFV